MTDAAHVLAAHQVESHGATASTPDRCTCGEAVPPEPDPTTEGPAVPIEGRRRRAFAAHQARALAAARAETATEDVEAAYRLAYDVMRHHPGIWHNSLRAAVEALADAGLLTTARTRPTREQIIEAIGHDGEWCKPERGPERCCDAPKIADAVLALLADHE